MYLCAACMPGVCGDQKTVFKPLELGLVITVSHHMNAQNLYKIL